MRTFDLGDGFTLAVGPKPDASLIEIGCVFGEGDEVVIVHAMDPARDKS
jgi:hypothetical protein